MGNVSPLKLFLDKTGIYVIEKGAPLENFNSILTTMADVFNFTYHHHIINKETLAACTCETNNKQGCAKDVIGWSLVLEGGHFKYMYIKYIRDRIYRYIQIFKLHERTNLSLMVIMDFTSDFKLVKFVPLLSDGDLCVL